MQATFVPDWSGESAVLLLPVSVLDASEPLSDNAPSEDALVDGACEVSSLSVRSMSPRDGFATASASTLCASRAAVQSDESI